MFGDTRQAGCYHASTLNSEVLDKGLVTCQWGGGEDTPCSSSTSYTTTTTTSRLLPRLRDSPSLIIYIPECTNLTLMQYTTGHIYIITIIIISVYSIITGLNRQYS